jgi:hypothetical protein
MAPELTEAEPDVLYGEPDVVYGELAVIANNELGFTKATDVFAFSMLALEVSGPRYVCCFMGVLWCMTGYSRIFA